MDLTKIRLAARALDEEKALEIVDKSTFGAVSMCAPDNTPYTAALNLARDGRKLYFHAAKEGLKVDLLRQNPKVCVLFVPKAVVVPAEYTTHYASAVVRGVAREVTDAVEGNHALRVICHRFAPELPEEAEHRIAGGATGYTGVWCIDMESITGKANPVGVIN